MISGEHYASCSDAQLLALCHQGDDSATDYLLEKYKGRRHRKIRKRPYLPHSSRTVLPVLRVAGMLMILWFSDPRKASIRFLFS